MGNIYNALIDIMSMRGYKPRKPKPKPKPRPKPKKGNKYV